MRKSTKNKNSNNINKNNDLPKLKRLALKSTVI